MPMRDLPQFIPLSGSSIELQLRSSAKDGWLEVEWRQPDDTSNWTKYAIPSRIGQTSTTG